MKRLFQRFGGRNQEKDKIKKTTFKLKRAQLRQQETLRELAAAEQQNEPTNAPAAGPSTS